MNIRLLGLKSGLAPALTKINQIFKVIFLSTFHSFHSLPEFSAIGNFKKVETIYKKKIVNNNFRPLECIPDTFYTLHYILGSFYEFRCLLKKCFVLIGF